MRWLTLTLMTAMTGCSSFPTSSGGGTDTTTTTSGAGGSSPTACGTAGTCSDCVACALGGPCAALYAACEQDSACSGIDQCYALCGNDTTCQQQCDASNPGGVTAFHAVTQCVYCQQCPSNCPGQCH